MVSLHNFVLVFISSPWVYCHSNQRYTSSNNQKITLVCKNKDMVRQFLTAYSYSKIGPVWQYICMCQPLQFIQWWFVYIQTKSLSFRSISFQECGAFATKHVSKDTTSDFRGYLCDIGYPKYEFVRNCLCCLWLISFKLYKLSYFWSKLDSLDKKDINWAK